jgi:hypothetical protein
VRLIDIKVLQVHFQFVFNYNPNTYKTNRTLLSNNSLIDDKPSEKIGHYSHPNPMQVKDRDMACAGAQMPES